MKIDDVEVMLKVSQAYASRQHADLLEHAIEIYRNIRLDNTDVDKTNGDILLFRWGTFGRESDLHFQVNLTRASTLDFDDPYDAMYTMRQLKIIFSYPCCAETDGFGKKNLACHLKDVTDFLARVKSSEAFEWVKNNQPTAVSISLD